MLACGYTKEIDIVRMSVTVMNCVHHGQKIVDAPDFNCVLA